MKNSKKHLPILTPVRRSIYFHIAAMNHWREVVMEQLGVLWRGGYRGVVKVGLVAGEHEDGFLRRVVSQYAGLELELVWHQEGVHQFEFPTLLALEAECRAGGCEEVLYFHTKGVSQPGAWNTMQWRWLMNADLLTRATEADLLADVDIVGSSYCHYVPTYRHFAGNFWAARASFIRQLPPLLEFKSKFLRDPIVPGWMTVRHAAELWLGASETPPRVKSLREDNLVLHDHQYYANQPELQDALMRVHVSG